MNHILKIAANGGDFYKSPEIRKAVISELNLESFANSRGQIRLNKVRNCLENDLIDLEGRRLEDLKKIYNLWRITREFIILDKETRKYHSDGTWDREDEYYAGECVKRGNGLYRWKLRKKFSWMNNLPNSGKIFNKKDRSSTHQTNVLFVSLTYDTKRCTRRKAWENVGKEYNRWISGLRKKYGDISVFRNWESTKKGYPHIHGTLIFDEKKFNSFAHKGKDGKISWRIQEKKEFENYHSHVDVKAVYHLGGQLNYLKKYLLKSHKSDLKRERKKGKKIPKISEEASDLTLALCWLFRKRSYGISGNLREKVFDLIKQLSNSNHPNPKLQQTLNGKPQEEIIWRFIDIILPEDLKPPPKKPKFGLFKIEKPSILNK